MRLLLRPFWGQYDASRRPDDRVWHEWMSTLSAHCIVYYWWTSVMKNFVPLGKVFGPPGLNISALNMKYSVTPWNIWSHVVWRHIKQCMAIVVIKQTVMVQELASASVPKVHEWHSSDKHTSAGEVCETNPSYVRTESWWNCSVALFAPISQVSTCLPMCLVALRWCYNWRRQGKPRVREKVVRLKRD